jgi:hypothetical protein
MPQPKASWQPLLRDDSQEQTLRVVAAIAETLPKQTDSSAYSTDLALFYAYLDKANCATTQAMYFLEQAVARLSNEPMQAGLYGGLAGTGWVLAHLAGWVYEVDEDDPNAVIDEALYEHVSQTPWTGDYDLISGLVGIGVYALERLPNPAGGQLLERVIEQLAALAEQQADGIAWHTAPLLLPDHQRLDFPNGYYNLGLSHGIPGVIALLSHALRAGVAIDVARPLLDGAVRWLLAQDHVPSPTPGEGWDGDGFPAYIHRNSQPKAARLAWCYGDVGIAAALLGTARRIGEPAWEEAALRIARRAAQRPYEQSGVRDGCLCHGAAGLAHLYNRFYQATGDLLFALQARHWIEQTLSLRQPDQGIAGYCLWRADVGWIDSSGFLEGAAGIALALLAACTPVEPAWDRLLLIDLN